MATCVSRYAGYEGELGYVEEVTCGEPNIGTVYTADDTGMGGPTHIATTTYFNPPGGIWAVNALAGWTMHVLDGERINEYVLIASNTADTVVHVALTGAVTDGDTVRMIAPLTGMGFVTNVEFNQNKDEGEIRTIFDPKLAHQEWMKEEPDGSIEQIPTTGSFGNELTYAMGDANVLADHVATRVFERALERTSPAGQEREYMNLAKTDSLEISISKEDFIKLTTSIKGRQVRHSNLKIYDGPTTTTKYIADDTLSGGPVQLATLTIVSVPSPVWTVNALAGGTLSVLTGARAGETAKIVSNIADTLTHLALTGAVADTDEIEVIMPDDVVVIGPNATNPTKIIDEPLAYDDVGVTLCLYREQLSFETTAVWTTLTLDDPASDYDGDVSYLDDILVWVDGVRQIPTNYVPATQVVTVPGGTGGESVRVVYWTEVSPDDYTDISTTINRNQTHQLVINNTTGKRASEISEGIIELPITITMNFEDDTELNEILADNYSHLILTIDTEVLRYLFIKFNGPPPPYSAEDLTAMDIEGNAENLLRD